MMKRIRNMFLACGMMTMGILSFSAQAAEAPHNEGAFAAAMQSDFNASSQPQSFRRSMQYAQKQTRPSVSPSQAKSIALRRNPGARFIDVQLRGNQYRVRLQLKNGRIKDVYVDAGRRQVRN